MLMAAACQSRVLLASLSFQEEVSKQRTRNNNNRKRVRLFSRAASSTTTNCLNCEANLKHIQLGQRPPWKNKIGKSQQQQQRASGGWQQWETKLTCFHKSNSQEERRRRRKRRILLLEETGLFSRPWGRMSENHHRHHPGTFELLLLCGNPLPQIQSARFTCSLPVITTSTMQIATSMNHLVQSASTSAATVLHNMELISEDVGLRISQLGSTSSLEIDTLAFSSWTGDLVNQVGAAVAVLNSAPITTPVAVIATIATTSSIIMSSLSVNESKQGFVEGRDLPLRYDAVAIAAYFRRRPVDILIRSAQVMFRCSALTASILIDEFVGRKYEKEKLRASQLVELITRLGPTAIKIGQALSIRPDILPVTYLEELQKLQDRVPPFSNQQAKEIILEGLGKPAEAIFSEMSAEPVAAASLGQVYKARMQETGDLVAVKVQRPGVLEGISRDLFLLRTSAKVFQFIPLIQSDLVGLLDTWALRFFDELDYVQEGKNAIQFSKNMKSLPNVKVPGVYLEYTCRKVLTCEWVNGEKLSESNAADLLPLVTTALNCYLVQLLETGFLHADPHPGNLLRTPDGHLCVLDFGLMTEVTEDQRYTLVEYISHVVNSDYPRVAEDLVRLGFVPPELADPQKTAAVAPQLGRIMGQLIQGGGARKINVQQLTEDLVNISKDYVFVIPPYFALILRAFSVLEGIGLDADPDYSIVDECYPYLSKRLLTDDSPRTRAALQYFLYGDKKHLDMQRVESLTVGFQNFRALMTPTGRITSLKKQTLIDPPTKEVLTVLFAPEGSFVQDLLLTELVRAVDALSREALAELWRYLARRIPMPAALAAPGSWPLLLPGLIVGVSPMARLTVEDHSSLETVRRLWVFIEPQLRQQSSPAELAEMAQDLLPVLRDLFPGLTTAAQRFVVMLIQRQALRLADDLDGGNSLREWDQGGPASIASPDFSKQRLIGNKRHPQVF
ncbi:unnamed protein product [Sphagnum jensenii]|uniref:Protein kinase domain-containing protein n=1 Tax=Sphagnum jensenii TaxID=128206 RepID=A0ABP1B8Y1_9BRYO